MKKSTSPIIVSKLLEDLPGNIREQVKELILENQDYLNQIDLNIRSVEFLKDYPSIRDGHLVRLNEKQTHDPSWFEAGYKDEYTFGVNFRFPSDDKKPYLFSITTELQRLDASNNRKEWRLESWFPEECKLPDKMGMIHEVERNLKANRVLVKMTIAAEMTNKSLKKRL